MKTEARSEKKANKKVPKKIRVKAKKARQKVRQVIKQIAAYQCSKKRVGEAKIKYNKRTKNDKTQQSQN